jgi:DNA-binding response OmpR family regulator
MGSFGASVLIVDDETVIADALAEILTKEGYKAFAAYDGVDAIDIALANPPDLLLTDVVMAGTNGIDLAVSIRNLFPDCKILLFSGQAVTRNLMAAAPAIAKEFRLLLKPIYPADLLRHIRTALETSENVGVTSKFTKQP